MLTWSCLCLQLQYAVVEMKSAFEAALEKLTHLEDRPSNSGSNSPKDSGQLADALRLLISYKVGVATFITSARTEFQTNFYLFLSSKVLFQINKNTEFLVLQNELDTTQATVRALQTQVDSLEAAVRTLSDERDNLTHELLLNGALPARSVTLLMWIFSPERKMRCVIWVNGSNSIVLRFEQLTHLRLDLETIECHSNNIIFIWCARRMGSLCGKMLWPMANGILGEARGVFSSDIPLQLMWFRALKEK